MRVDAVLRRRLVEDDVKFEGLLVVGRFESELVLLAGGRARRAFRQGSHADGDAHAFARRRGGGFFRRGGVGGGRRGRLGGASCASVQQPFAFRERLVSRGAAAAGVLVFVERCGRREQVVRSPGRGLRLDANSKRTGQ